MGFVEAHFGKIVGLVHESAEVCRVVGVCVLREVEELLVTILLAQCRVENFENLKSLFGTRDRQENASVEPASLGELVRNVFKVV